MGEVCLTEREVKILSVFTEYGITDDDDIRAEMEVLGDKLLKAKHAFCRERGEPGPFERMAFGRPIPTCP